jgi:hypothetical protein
MSVTLSGVGGTFSCPEGTHKKVEPYDVTLGRIKLTLQQVRRQEHGLERRYPSHRAPGPAVDKYNALRHRDHHSLPPSTQRWMHGTRSLSATAPVSKDGEEDSSRGSSTSFP